MCSRFRSVKDYSLLNQYYQLNSGINAPYNPNVAPTDEAPIVLPGEIAIGRFGLKMGPRQVLNARTDSIRAGSFRTAYTQKRCIIPAEGFYEWREENGKKQPYMFSLKSGELLWLAGLWQDGEFKGEKTKLFAIVTDEPNEIIAPYHDRMPLAVADPKTWLGEENPLASIQPITPGAFIVRPMNPKMNSPRVKDIESIEPAEG